MRAHEKFQKKRAKPRKNKLFKPF